MIYIFHNQRCRKSRECLAFLREQKVSFEIIYYLEKPPTFDQLKLIIKKLDINPIALVRRSEKKWIENYKNKTLSDDEIIHISDTEELTKLSDLLHNNSV